MHKTKHFAQTFFTEPRLKKYRASRCRHTFLFSDGAFHKTYRIGIVCQLRKIDVFGQSCSIFPGCISQHALGLLHFPGSEEPSW